MKQPTNPWVKFLKPEHDLHAQRIDPAHSLDLFWAVNAEGQYMFVYEYDDIKGEKKVSLPELKGIKASISSVTEKSSRNRLILTLMNSSNWEIFFALCSDIVSSTETTKPNLGLRAIISRLGKWQELLKRVNLEILSEEKIKGLLGELLFLKQYLIPAFGANSAVRFWQGPLGNAQDFSVNNCAIEVKCHEGTDSSEITISSADQLSVNLSELFLFIYIIGKSNRDSSGSVSLPKIITELRYELENSSQEDLDLFNRLLYSVGYIDHEQYLESCYIVVKTLMFKVTNKFPRICTDDLRAGVSDVSYKISLSSCKGYEDKPNWMVY